MGITPGKARGGKWSKTVNGAKQNNKIKLTTASFTTNTVMLYKSLISIKSEYRSGKNIRMPPVDRAGIQVH
jgi:hypothetical protein